MQSCCTCAGAGSRKTARVIIPWIMQTLVHQLVAVAIGRVHLRPVMMISGAATEAGQLVHATWGCCRSVGNNWRPFVRSVRVLLHVLGKVSLLGVTLAAVGTDVGLQVFGLLVLRDVLEQGGLVVEALVARVALVGLVRLVAPGVRLQVGQLREGLRAT